MLGDVKRKEILDKRRVASTATPSRDNSALIS